MIECHGEIAIKLKQNIPMCPNALGCKSKTAQYVNYSKCARLRINYNSVDIGRQVTIYQPSKKRIMNGQNCRF